MTTAGTRRSLATPPRSWIGLFAVLVVFATVAGAVSSPGRVVLASGEPASGATVRAYLAESTDVERRRVVDGRDRDPLATAVADARGRFALDLPPRTIVDVVVEHRGAAPWRRAVLAGSPLGAVRLIPADLRSGAVTLDGRPASGARLVWHDGSGQELVTAIANEHGRYELPDPSTWASSAVVLHPDAAIGDLATGMIQFSGHGGHGAYEDPRRLDRELDRGETVSGRVLADDGPIAGAEIWSLGWPVAVTDAAGRFSARVPRGAARLEARLGARRGLTSIDLGRDATIRLGPPRIVDGAVVDESGRGIRGARVFVASASSHRGYDGVQRFVTDRDGGFEAHLDADAVSIWVDLPGFEVRQPHRELDLRRTAELDTRFVGVRRRAIRGVVRDSKGSPVGGARIVPAYGDQIFYGVPAALDRSFETRSDGRFWIPGSSEWYTERWLVLAKGLPASVLDTGSNPTGSQERFEVRLDPGIRSVIDVIDVDGHPIPGATVAIAEGPPQWSAPAMLADESNGILWLYRTGASGRVVVRLPERAHHVGVRATGFAPAGVDSFRPVADGSSSVRVTLRPSVAIRGRVAFADDGAPVESAHVSIQGEALHHSAATDDGGWFELDGLAPGPYMLRISADGALDPTPRRVAAPADGLEITLDRGHEIEGVLVASDTLEPVPNATVRSETVGTTDTAARSTTTDPDGAFTLTALPVGRVVVHVSADGFVAHRSDEVELTPHGVALPLELRLERGLEIEGVVTDENGDPVADASLRLHGLSDEPDNLWTSSEPDGAFRFGGVGVGAYRLELTASGFVAHSESIEIDEGTGPLQIELSRGDSMAGRVVDERGSALEGASLMFSAPGGGHGWGMSDADGRFEVSGLKPARRWELVVSRDGYLEEALDDLDPAGRDLEIELRPMPKGTVYGHVSGIDPDRGPALTVAVSGSVGSASGPIDDDGRYQIEESPAGDVTVTLNGRRLNDSLTESRRAIVPEGGDVRVDFDLRERIPVDGRVVRGDEPQAGAVVAFAAERGQAETSTDTDLEGRFETSVRPGRYRLSVWVPGGGSHQEAVDVSGPTTLEIDVAGSELVGRVVEAGSEQGLGGVRVELMPTSWRDDGGYGGLPQVETDGSGSFRMTDTPPGRFVLRASHERFGAELLEVDLERGETTTVEIALEPTDGLVVRLVEAFGGSPLEGPIVVRSASGQVVWDDTAPREADGYRIPLGSGDYKVSVSATGYASRTVRARVPVPEPLVIALTPGGTLVVRSELLDPRVARLVAPDGEEYVRCWCNQISAFQVDGSETLLEQIAPGPYTLVIEELDGSASQYPVDVVEGDVTEVAIY